MKRRGKMHARLQLFYGIAMTNATARMSLIRKEGVISCPCAYL